LETINIPSDDIQGDHLSGNPENIREFNSCQVNVRKNHGQGILFMAQFMFGVHQYLVGSLRLVLPVLRILLLSKAL